ncbi:MAG: VWA domain-containing protein [Bryobacteraceae bacterium]
MLPRCAVLLLSLCAPLLAQPGASGAPDSAGLNLKSDARPVLVDTVVTGNRNEPIHGLAATDFHLFEDGKEQTVTAFQTHTGPAVQGMSQQQRFVLLFGAQAADAQKWLQQAAASFIADNAGPSRLMSIVYTDACYGTTSTPFTADAGRLQQALSNWPDLLHCDHVAAPDTNLRALYYAELAKDLAHVPGHKVVALFVATAGPSASAAANELTEAVAPSRRGRARSQPNAEAHQDPFDMELEFRKADASVYPVEAQPGVATPGWALDLAGATGGHEFSRGAGPTIFEQLAREQNESYALAYLPKASAEGSCHAIKVTIDRPGVTVRGRNLYCNVRQVSVAAAKPKENDLESLAESADAGNTAASASVPFFYEANGVARVNLALDIPSPVLVATEIDSKLHAEMDILGLVYHPGGDVTARFTHKLRFDFDNRRQFDDFLRRPLHYEQQFEVEPGNYRFKVVFRSAKDRLGAVETALDVDPFNAGQLNVSSIALSRDVQPISPEAAQEELEDRVKPLIFRGNRIVVSGSDVLSKTGTAEAYFEIYEPFASGAGAIRLTMRLRVLDAQSNQLAWNSGDVDLSTLAESGNKVIPVALKLPVATLPPGTYHAELTVKDSAGAQVTRSIQFHIE